MPTRSLVIALAALLTTGAMAAAQSPARSPLPPLFDDTAIPATPIPGSIVDPTATTWDHVRIEPDGRTLTVAFWNGAQACVGLDRVEVTDEAGTLRITPWIGARVDAAGADCADIRQLYSTVVTLEAPILAGGGEAWTAVDLGPDGRTGWAFFTGGDEACSSFDHLTVDTTGTVPQLSVVYRLASPQPDLCTAIGINLEAPFVLPAPILLGGDPPA